LLHARNIPFVYREYTTEPLSRAEIEAVLAALGLGVQDVLRKRDAAKFGFSGQEGDDVLLDAMVAFPRMLQRPIGLLDGRAALGRPPENLLSLFSS
jgi:arsenate reductase (glutaredoxin)